MVIGREVKLDSMEKNWASAGAKFVVVYGSHKSGKTAFGGVFLWTFAGAFGKIQKKGGLVWLFSLWDG